MLEIKDITKSYRTKDAEVKALDGVSISFSDKGLVVVLGRSGCGKSTLLSILGGINSADSGTICYDGKNIDSFTDRDMDALRNSYIGFVFQETNLLDNLTVEENLRIAADLQNRTVTAGNLERALGDVGLSGYGKRLTNELSGGQKQRVSIARAVIKDTKIILADEPTGNLDSKTGRDIFHLLKSLSEERLVIVVSHDRENTFQFADRIIEISDGKIISDITKTANTESRLCDREKPSVRFPQDRPLSSAEIDELKLYLASLAKEDIPKLDIGFAEDAPLFAATPEQPQKAAEYKAVMPKIPFRFSLKMAWSNIKSGKIGLIFTVFILVLSISLFGIAQIFSSYNVNEASLKTFKENGVNTIRVRQGKYDELISAVRTVDSLVFDTGFEDAVLSEYGQAPYRIYELFMMWSENEFSSFPFKPDSNKLLTVENEEDLLKLGYKGIKYGNFIGDPDTANSKNYLELLIPDILMYLTVYHYPMFTFYSYIPETYPLFCEFMAEEIARLPSGAQEWILGTGANQLGGIFAANYHLPRTDFYKLMNYFMPYTEKLSEFIIRTELEFDGVCNSASFEYKIVGIVDTGMPRLFEAAKQANASKVHSPTKTYDQYIDENLYSNFCQLFIGGKDDFESYSGFVQVYANKYNGQTIEQSGTVLEKDWWVFRRYSVTHELPYFAMRDSGTLLLRSGYSHALHEIEDGSGKLAYSVISPDGEEGLSDNDLIMPYNDFISMFGEGAADKYFAQNGGAQPAENLIIRFKCRDYDGGTVYSANLRVVGILSSPASRGNHNPQNDYYVNDGTLHKLFFGYSHYNSYMIPLAADAASNNKLLSILGEHAMYHSSAVSGILYSINTLMKTVVKIFEILVLFTALLGIIQIYSFSRRSVKKRLKEIGILRAMGASAANVIKIFLLEVLLVIVTASVLAVMLTALGAGTMNGVILNNSALITNITGLQNIALIYFSFGAVALTLVFCLILTLLSLALPVLLASRIKPFEAMRSINRD